MNVVGMIPHVHVYVHVYASEYMRACVLDCVSIFVITEIRIP